MENRNPGIVKPALIAGSIFGFLSGTPFVGGINCACCALVVAAGFVAALLHSRDLRFAGLPFDAGAGSRVGFLAGVVCGIVETIISLLSGLLFHTATEDWLIGLLEQIPDISPELIDQIRQGIEKSFAAGVGIELMINLGLGIIFATIGGLIGAAVFKSRTETPPPPPAG